jgi:hypothetical protein
MVNFRATASVLHTVLIKANQKPHQAKLPTIIETQMMLLSRDKAVVPQIWMKRLRALTK